MHQNQVFGCSINFLNKKITSLSKHKTFLLEAISVGGLAWFGGSLANSHQQKGTPWSPYWMCQVGVPYIASAISLHCPQRCIRQDSHEANMKMEAMQELEIEKG